MPGLLGKKIGMTSVFSADGKNVPCTVIEVGPCTVTQVKSVEKDGYAAVQVGFQDKKEKHTSAPLMGHFKKAGVTPKRHLAEFKNFETEYNLGDVITVDISDEKSSDILPIDIPVRALYEDEYIAVFDKPTNMPTHPSHGHFEDTLANALANHFAKDGVPFRPRFINRLDRNTSGLLLSAKNPHVAFALAQKAEKTYLAIVCGEL